MAAPLPDIHTPTSRRSFLLGMAASGVGIVLAPIWSPELVGKLHVTTAPQPAAAFEPSTWIRIDPDGQITFKIAKSEMGQGIRTSFAMIIAEELDADWNAVRVQHALPHELKKGEKIETTGGSNSILLNYEQLRATGAAAKAMLCAAAARIWGIDASDCRTQKSVVTEVNGSRSMTYGELSEQAAKEEIPLNPQLKQASEFTLIGTRKPHIDTADIVSGKAKYGIDIRLPGMKYAVLVTSPTLGASIRSIDTSEALKIDGVLRVEYVPELGYVVLANTTYAALQGRKALIIDWNTDSSATLSSPLISEKLKAAIGSLPALPSDTAFSIEAEYELPYLAHATMEPMNCVCDVRATSAEIWCGTQVPDFLRTDAAKLLSLPVENVRVHVPLLGGGFGRRLYIDVAKAAVLISRAFSLPVSFLLTRSDDMQIDYYRPASYHQCKAGVDASGKISGIIHATVNGENTTFPPYQMPAPTTMYNGVYIPIQVGAWRSVGHSSSVFVNESIIDELAVLAGKDPFEFRRNMLPEGSRLRAVLEKAAELSGWYDPLPKGRARGIACYSWSSDIAHVVEVSVSSLGQLSIHRITAVIDCGVAINPMGVEAQLQGAAVDALSTVLTSAITLDRGRIMQQSFAEYGWLRMNEMPRIDVHIMPGTRPPLGVGEIGYPSVPPAVCNAIYRASGTRIRRLPIRQTPVSGAEETAKESPFQLTIMPNPAVDSVRITGSIPLPPQTTISMTFENILGSRLASITSTINDHSQVEQTISFPPCPAGAYFIRLTAGSFVHIQQIIKL